MEKNISLGFILPEDYTSSTVENISVAYKNKDKSTVKQGNGGRLVYKNPSPKDISYWVNFGRFPEN